MFREDKKESYERLEMEVIAFDVEDLIVTSYPNGDGDTPWQNL